METFQNLRVLSLLTDTGVLPSGEKARRPTPWVCPLQTPVSLPVLVSHNRAESEVIYCCVLLLIASTCVWCAIQLLLYDRRFVY